MISYIRILISLLALLFMAFPVQAEPLRLTIETEITEEGEKSEKNSQVITIDGKQKARIEFLGEEQKPSDTTPYLLTIDGGNNWVVGNKAEAFCAKMDTADFFKYLGKLLNKASGIANLEITDQQLKKELEEKGPKIHGHPTTHVRFVTTANGKAAVGFKKYEYEVKVTDDIWYSSDLEMHPVRRLWLESLSQSGYSELDSLINKLLSQIPGAILKQESVVRAKNVIKDEEDVYTEKTRVATLEKLKPADIPESTFQMPECQKISKKQMRNTAKKLLDQGKLI